MRHLRLWFVLLLAGQTMLPRIVEAKDYLTLKSGQIIECAILKADSAFIRITDWESRGMLQPKLQVFTRDEVRTISFSKPTAGASVARKYVRRANLFELGGGAAFQTWAESRLVRRSLVQFHLTGGYTIVPFLGLELDGAMTIPLGGAEDSVWQSYDIGYQVSMNIVGQPVEWKGLVPFALVGGGTALGVPVENVMLTSSTQARNLVNFGLGVKTGTDGVGFRLEWRHHFYTWTPDEVNAFGVRVREHSADMSAVRASLFIYR